MASSISPWPCPSSVAPPAAPALAQNCALSKTSRVVTDGLLGPMRLVQLPSWLLCYLDPLSTSLLPENIASRPSSLSGFVTLQSALLAVLLLCLCSISLTSAWRFVRPEAILFCTGTGDPRSGFPLRTWSWL